MKKNQRKLFFFLKEKKKKNLKLKKIEFRELIQNE
jgi:hypothetical protein